MALDTLAKYEAVADQWMSAVPMESSFGTIPKGRLHTFRYAFQKLYDAQRHKKLVIVELGTSRSFVDGAYPGCNSDDSAYWNPHDFTRWDFGAGMFTYLCAEYLKTNCHSYEQYTVDLAPSHIARCKVMTHPFGSKIDYRISDSVTFLNSFGTKCDLIYLDTGDMTPVEPTAQLQLKEAEAIVKHKLIEPGGFVLIDDVRNPASLQQNAGALGKAKYSIPYLHANGFVTVMDEYQVLLQFTGQ